MADSFQLRGRVITVSGAAVGIGRAISEYLAARGASLALADVRTLELARLQDELVRQFPACTVACDEVDVRSPEAVDGWISKAREKFGRIDGCVNNAGTRTLGAGAGGPELTPSELSWVTRHRSRRRRMKTGTG